MITELRVKGYRSLRDMWLTLDRLNVITGANGSGKSNMYRSMYLLHSAANGRLTRVMAEEGGMPSILWAGQRSRNDLARLVLGVTLQSGLSYELQAGLPEANEIESQAREDEADVPFELDPRIKSETATFRSGRSKTLLLERGKTNATLRDADGTRVTFNFMLMRHESILSQLAEPHRFPQLSMLREELSKWRFYHGFRSDESSPIRQPQIGILTPILSHDGLDLAAALATIQLMGDAEGLRRAVRQGLEGATLSIECVRAYFSVGLQMPGIQRRLDGRELSDGMLRYLCLLAALYSPRPAAVLALNEPENSLHPDLIPPLAAQIVAASSRTQIWVTTHSTRLADEIARLGGITPVVLKKVKGETISPGSIVTYHNRNKDDETDDD